LNENALFEIVDMVGKVQKSQLINHNQGVAEIDLSNVPNGVYIIILKENGSVRLNQRFCVIH
jgi:Secretion system C-terminal sorting domain